MSAITAKDVKALRDRTGAGVLACREALTETSGDIERAGLALIRVRDDGCGLDAAHNRLELCHAVAICHSEQRRDQVPDVGVHPPEQTVRQIANVDADAHCHKAPAFVRPSDPASREASQNLLRLLSIRSAGELASRANGASHGGLPHF